MSKCYIRCAFYETYKVSYL